MEDQQVVYEETLDENYDAQFAEDIQEEEKEEIQDEGKKKRELLEKTKIVKQTWSILEIFQKIDKEKLILNPDYQRNVVWESMKKVAFIESLFMGIIIPPIYVVEMPIVDILEGNKYEVVDGKQRLSTIQQFLQNNLTLNKGLEYFNDVYGNKKFEEINKEYPNDISDFLSSVLDVYVISASSPEFTKYDIFARLNKGSAPLKVNEIRKAIYRSPVLEVIEEYIKENVEKSRYKNLFSVNDIKRYEDYGRFFSSLAYLIKTDPTQKIVLDYNSRPREMINDVLSKIQENKITINKELIVDMINETINLMERFKALPSSKYLIESCIFFAVNKRDAFYAKINDIMRDDEILETFSKSPSTTANVNKRIERIVNIINE